MENNGRRLGWIAIAIGVVALVVALGGRWRESRMAGFEHYDRGPIGYGQQWEGPQGQFPPNDGESRGQFGPRDGFGPGADFGPRGDFGRGHHMGPWAHCPGFLFLPFMIFGGLFKLALVAGLILLVLKLSGRGRNWRGPRGRWGRGGPGGPGGHEGHDHPQASQRPEPYTGETTNL